MTQITLTNGHSVRVVVSSGMVMFKHDPRSWRDRFFSRPWRPWITHGPWYDIPASMLHGGILTINPALIDDIDRVLADRKLVPLNEPAHAQLMRSDLAAAIRHDPRQAWPEL